MVRSGKLLSTKKEALSFLGWEVGLEKEDNLGSGIGRSTCRFKESSVHVGGAQLELGQERRLLLRWEQILPGTPNNRGRNKNILRGRIDTSGSFIGKTLGRVKGRKRKHEGWRVFTKRGLSKRLS